MAAEYRVLVVDDDFHVARLHAAYVASVPGFGVLDPVSTGEAALRAVSAHRPDLVLMDLYLPDRHGLEIIASIDVDTVVLSAANDPESVRRALRRGALSYLIKPFSAEKLTAMLRGYARYRRLLSSEANLRQEGIDRALRQIHPAETSMRARSVTEQAVLRALRVNSGARLTAVEVASAVGVSRATAQRYLSVLAEDGIIEVTLRYGVTGRPEHHYAVPEAWPPASEPPETETAQ